MSQPDNTEFFPSPSAFRASSRKKVSDLFSLEGKFASMEDTAEHLAAWIGERLADAVLADPDI